MDGCAWHTRRALGARWARAGRAPLCCGAQWKTDLFPHFPSLFLFRRFIWKLMDGRTRAGRAPLCCVRGACPARLRCNANRLISSADALSTNLFPSLFLSSLPIFFFLAFSTLMDGCAPGARLVSGERWARASVLCEERPLRVWCDARPARARHTMRPAPNCRARDTFYQPMVYNDIGGRARASALCVRLAGLACNWKHFYF